MNSRIAALRTLAEVSEKSRANHFSLEQIVDGKVETWVFTAEKGGTRDATPADLAPIGICENLKYLIEMPGEYAGTPEAIVPALEEFQQILDLLNDLSARVAAIEAPANVPA